MCVDTLAPFSLTGSFLTCTKTLSPTLVISEIAGTICSSSSFTTSILGIASLTGIKAFLEAPISKKEACIPSTTFFMIPEYIFPRILSFSTSCTYFSHITLFSTTHISIFLLFLFMIISLIFSPYNPVASAALVVALFISSSSSFVNLIST